MDYRILGHREMLLDHIRMKAYREAIHATVRPGDVVADLGTGSGVLAFFALQAGASKVYAIERHAIIFEAEKLAESNGLAEQVIFIKGSSDQINLPEPVDVIIAELIGNFGLEENLPHYLIDFRDRFLKPGGALVPIWLDLYLIPVESPALWDFTVGLWDKDFYGLDFSAVRRTGFSERYDVDCRGKIRWMAAAIPLARLNFASLPEVPTTFQMHLPIESGGTIHGYVGYFQLGLSPEIMLSTSPDDLPTHWQQVFFPLPEPIAVQPGDILEAKVNATRFGDIIWRWDTSIITHGERRLAFSQNNLRIPRKEVMLINRENFVPTLSVDGEIHQLALQTCNGKRTIPEIARVLQDAYPERYYGLNQAIEETRSILEKNIQV